MRNIEEERRYYRPKQGSLGQPLRRTPLELVSIRKWRTSSLVRSTPTANRKPDTLVSQSLQGASGHKLNIYYCMHTDLLLLTSLPGSQPGQTGCRLWGILAGPHYTTRCVCVINHYKPFLSCHVTTIFIDIVTSQVGLSTRCKMTSCHCKPDRPLD